MRFLTSWRLALAADMLCDPEATVGTVAHALGYSTPYALSTAFKRVRGISPQEHRARAMPARFPTRIRRRPAGPPRTPGRTAQPPRAGRSEAAVSRAFPGFRGPREPPNKRLQRICYLSIIDRFHPPHPALRGKGGYVSDSVAVDAKRILLRYGAPIAVLDKVSEAERIEFARAISRPSTRVSPSLMLSA